jgi:lysyl-tRNA synthetase class II
MLVLFPCSVCSRNPPLEAKLTALGRVRSVRSAGSKLMFLDIERDSQRLQVMIELKKLAASDSLDEDFKGFKKVIRLGDWICKWHPLLLSFEPC